MYGQIHAQSCLGRSFGEGFGASSAILGDQSEVLVAPWEPRYVSKAILEGAFRRGQATVFRAFLELGY